MARPPIGLTSASAQPEGAGAPELPTPREAAAYIRDMAASLHGIARAHSFDTLTFVLEMAALEADRLAKS